MRFSQKKLIEIYNLVNAEYLEQKNSGTNYGKGRKSEVSMIIVETVYREILGGRIIGWGVLCNDLRAKQGISCGQEKVFDTVRAAEKVLDMILVSKFKPRGKKKASEPNDLSFNHLLNKLFPVARKGELTC
jgi:hypothetical protein